jgi:hypothetical protein
MNLLNTQPNYILNQYPNATTPGLLSPTPSAALPPVMDPWGNNPTASGPADAPSDPYSGQGSLSAQDIGKSMQGAGTVMSLLGVPVAPLFSLVGKGLSNFGGGTTANPSPGQGGPAASSPAGGAQAAAGHAPGTGVGNAAATQSRNDPHPTPTGIAADGQGDGTNDTGDTVICTELYRQGIMPRHIWEADERFGDTLDKTARDGYHIFAIPWVKVMQRSPLATRLTWLVARPWAQHMAFQMGALEEDNAFGRMLMKIGIPLCRVLQGVLQGVLREFLTRRFIAKN